MKRNLDKGSDVDIDIVIDIDRHENVSIYIIYRDVEIEMS